MKKVLLFGILGCVALFASSCSTIQHNVTQAQARAVESELRMITVPVIGELEMLSNTNICDSLEFFIGDFEDAEKDIVPFLDDYKRYTMANYCTKNGCDVILNPLFQISTNAAGDKMKVIITGFPAKYVKFRNASQEDKWMFDTMNDAGSARQRLERVINSTEK